MISPDGEWQYHLGLLDGAGGEIFIDHELPLNNPQLTRTLSGPHQITGELQMPVDKLLDDFGRPVIKRWASTVYANQEGNDEIWCGGMVADYALDGPNLTLDVVGMVGYPKDMPYTDSVYYVEEDPLDIVRAVWAHVQSQPGGDIGLNWDNGTTPVRLGTQLENVQFETQAGQMVQFEAGPVKFNWWSNHDISGRIDSLAKETPFDYLEQHKWFGENVLHTVTTGYPTLGTRQQNLRFVLGENVFKMPGESYAGEDAPTGFLVLGSGEGRAMVKGYAEVTTPGLVRRIAVVQDKKLTSKARAQKRAQQLNDRAQHMRERPRITELTIRNHSNAPFGSFDVGDEIPYNGDHDWGPVGDWVKITKMTISPQDSEDIIASVERIEV